MPDAVAPGHDQQRGEGDADQRDVASELYRRRIVTPLSSLPHKGRADARPDAATVAASTTWRDRSSG